MADRVKFTRKIVKWGDSTVITLPRELIEYLELDEGSQIELQDDVGKHGRFISFWKKTGE